MKLLNTVLNILSASKVAETTSTSTPELVFEPQNFISMLGYMGKGMLVIFVIIGVIILATLLINKIFSGNKKD